MVEIKILQKKKEFSQIKTNFGPKDNLKEKKIDEKENQLSEKLFGRKTLFRRNNNCVLGKFGTPGKTQNTQTKFLNFNNIDLSIGKLKKINIWPVKKEVF